AGDQVDRKIGNCCAKRGAPMLKGEKILVTGPGGNIAFPLCRELAKDNEVWGIARFNNPDDRAKVDALGVKTLKVDLGTGDFTDLPDDFDYVLHLAASIGGGEDFDSVLRVNAEGTGLLLSHCRKAKAVLVMSSTSVYHPHEDPWHPYAETDRLGDSQLPGMPTYGLSKLIQEGVARTCARQFGLPIVIARMNAAYGSTGSGGLPGHLFNSIREGLPVTLRWDPNPYSFIHYRDIFDQIPALLEAASVPATIVNWGGDEPVPAQDLCAFFGEILNVKPMVEVREFPGAQRSVVNDNTRRMAITGPCKVHWRDGMRELAEAQLAKARLAPDAR
ncbi:MAG: NAD(P)-dependent oxidoreductase, partial [Sphingomonadaceae bacterium]|nr:NAD(P)-dependent oxidoreductase [Sphingomonadaceae bacterium]